MTVESLIIFLLIGAVAGWLAGIIVKGFGFGLVGNIVIGILPDVALGLGVSLGLAGALVSSSAIAVRPHIRFIALPPGRRDKSAPPDREGS